MNCGNAFDLPRVGRLVGAVVLGLACVGGALVSVHRGGPTGAVLVQACIAGFLLRDALLTGGAYLAALRWRHARDRWAATPGAGRAPRRPRPIRPCGSRVLAVLSTTGVTSVLVVLVLVVDAHPGMVLTVGLVAGAALREVGALVDAQTARPGHPVPHTRPRV